jgi:hypothetical protein
LVETRENGAGLAENRTGVGLDLAADDLHQRGFTRAIATDQTQAFTRIDLKVDLIKDRRTTETEINIKETEQSHKRPNLSAAWLALQPCAQ